MKKFITYISFQPENRLNKNTYKAMDNEKLEYDGETRFPIIQVLNGYAEPEDEIEVIAMTADYDNCRRNLELLKQEVSELCDKKSVKCREIKVIDVAYDDSVQSNIDNFQKLINEIEDGDELFACITYGTKPNEMAEMMALRYARQVKKNTHIGCVAYGKFDHDSNQCYIYDETALLQLDDIMHILVKYNDPDPKKTIEKILAL